VNVYEAFDSPLGTLYLRFDGRVLTGISFEKPPVRLGRAPERFKKELRAYFAGTLREFAQEASPPGGTAFERKVWRAVQEVPYGETRSYKWLAERVDTPRGSRAVGQALGKNPIPIVIPCHRIVESDGHLGGYASGEDVKRRLLALEYYHAGHAGGGAET
jgi:O-6-methylguanine DNA methyltransferase